MSAAVEMHQEAFEEDTYARECKELLSPEDDILYEIWVNSLGDLK